jgi:hypothetical protein
MPPTDLAHDDGAERAGRLRQRECAGDDGGDREAVEDERGRVVGEPFAFQHQHDAARQAEPARDRQRRHHVGRRDDGAQHEADRPVELEQIMRRRRHRAGGEHHAAEGEQCDRPQVETEFTPAHGEAGRIDQRRQDHQQHEFWRQLHLRQPWHQRHADAGNHQQDRGRNVEPLGRDRDCRQDRQHEQQRLHGRGHRAVTPA